MTSGLCVAPAAAVAAATKFSADIIAIVRQSLFVCLFVCQLPIVSRALPVGALTAWAQLANKLLE